MSSVTSTQDEWKREGEIAFTRGQYDQAIFCFRKAGLELEEAITSAYIIRAQAQAILFRSNAKDLQKPKATYIEAAEAFWSCAQRSSDDQRLGCFRLSGKCFEDAGEHHRAAEAYRAAKDFTSSATQYRKAGIFDECVRVIMENRAEVDEKVADTLLDVSKFYYLKNKDILLEKEGDGGQNS